MSVAHVEPVSGVIASPPGDLQPAPPEQLAAVASASQPLP
jgi:hypothetical protein